MLTQLETLELILRRVQSGIPPIHRSLVLDRTVEVLTRYNNEALAPTRQRLVVPREQTSGDMQKLRETASYYDRQGSVAFIHDHSG